MNRLSPILVSLLLVIGCKRSADDPVPANAPYEGTTEADPLDYPKRGKAAVGDSQVSGPKDSLAIKFTGFVRTRMHERDASFLVTNHFSKDIIRVELTLNYLDKTDHQIDSTPSTISYSGGAIYCHAGETILDAEGLNAPENTAEVRIVVERIRFSDGTEWKP